MFYGFVMRHIYILHFGYLLSIDRAIITKCKALFNYQRTKSIKYRGIRDEKSKHYRFDIKILTEDID